ncbi:MAG: protein tyrosine phosphatase [Hyphomicrobiaceae bacterium]|nr:MAG: protein tyrosine phosphatase [Hyphomicrobiaceae bacterium]
MTEADTARKRRVDSERREGSIHVCPLSAVSITVERHKASHLLTCIHDDSLVETPRRITPANHLRLVMDDIIVSLPDYTPPNEMHIARLIDFARGWGGEGPMVVHCWAGISRSTAAAFISLCALNPDAPEDLIAGRLRRVSPTAQPNRLMVRLADDALGRGGRMVDAVDAIGRGVPASEAVPFSLPARIARTGGR